MIAALQRLGERCVDSVPTPMKPRSPAPKGAPFHVMVRKVDTLVKSLLIVTANYDSDTKMWSAASTELGGLFLQTTSWKSLVDAVPAEIDKHLPPSLFRRRRDIAIEVGGFQHQH